MEIRTIMLHLLRRFEFQLAEPYATWVQEHPGDVARELGVNLGTMGPRDLTQPDMVKFWDGYSKPPLGMLCNIVRRESQV
jgi:hypothetical protein